MTLTEKDIVDRVTGITRVRLKSWVARGWISPAQTETGRAFSELDVARCDLIRQMRDDLEIDSETVPALLSLLDQVYGLRRELRVMVRAIEKQPPNIRDQIVSAIGELKKEGARDKTE